MSLRIANVNDLDTVVQLCFKFQQESPYRNLSYNYTKVKEVCLKMITGNKNEYIVLLSPNGILAGLCTSPFLFSDTKVASELVWYVEPEYRGTEGKHLHQAFEYWAKRVGCTLINMVLLEDENSERMNKIYKRKGYSPVERSYIKEL